MIARVQMQGEDFAIKGYNKRRYNPRLFVSGQLFEIRYEFS